MGFNCHGMGHFARQSTRALKEMALKERVLKERVLMKETFINDGDERPPTLQDIERGFL